MKRTPFAIALSLLAATPALAQQPPAGSAYRQPHATIVFDRGDTVVGELPVGAEIVSVRRPVQPGSLLSLRSHFIPEMLKSAEEL